MLAVIRTCAYWQGKNARFAPSHSWSVVVSTAFCSCRCCCRWWRDRTSGCLGKGRKGVEFFNFLYWVLTFGDHLEVQAVNLGMNLIDAKGRIYEFQFGDEDNRSHF